MSVSWWNTSPQVQAASPEVSLLPLACLEKHWHYLPAETDQLILSEISARVAKSLSMPAFLLPVWPLGTSFGSIKKDGRVALGSATVWAVVKDIVTSLHEHGLHQVVVINNTGSAAKPSALPWGNEIVKTAVRQLNYENPGLAAIWLQPFRSSRKALQKLFSAVLERDLDETVAASILMVLSHQAAPLQFDNLHEASAEKGRQALGSIVDAAVEYIEKTFNLLEQVKNQPPPA